MATKSEKFIESLMKNDNVCARELLEESIQEKLQSRISKVLEKQRCNELKLKEKQ